MNVSITEAVPPPPEVVTISLYMPDATLLMQLLGHSAKAVNWHGKQAENLSERLFTALSDAGVPTR